MPAPSRNDIYEAVIRKMVAQALEEQEALFEQEHGQDPDEGLICYLQDWTRELGYTPRFKEIVGWRLLEQRFGTWNEALHRAGLTPPPRYPVTKLPRILAETERQQELYRRKKAEKKRKNKQRLEAQVRKKKENVKVRDGAPPAQSLKETLPDCTLDSVSSPQCR